MLGLGESLRFYMPRNLRNALMVPVQELKSPSLFLGAHGSLQEE